MQYSSLRLNGNPSLRSKETKSFFSVMDIMVSEHFLLLIENTMQIQLIRFILIFDQYVIY